jgi:hypothetical protein
MKKMILAYVLTVVWGLIFFMCTAGIAYVVDGFGIWNLWLCCVIEVVIGLVIAFVLNRIYECMGYRCRIFR